MTSREIRRTFLDYFEKHGHAVVASSSLVPADDPTLLFTNAGMNQFKDLFLGKERRAYRRATTSQKCMRVSGKHNDLDNVGPSLRHHTFFEMLGNFSFGDYFKTDAIPFAWELLTTVWQLPAERLFPTIFKGEAGIPRDDEAFAIWQRFVPASRITELGLAENFWQMGDTGPCGRCSEIHYFRGNDIPCEEEQTGRPCRGLDCSCDRYVEVWNNVFMEFDRQPDGTLQPLPAPSIDTGMGLERITAVIQGKLSNYDTDLFMPILEAIGARAKTRYQATLSGPSDVSMRVIADHLRAMTFLIADGVVPSNEWRGYVLRKIMRRAMRHGKKLGITEPFLHALVDVVVAEMGDAYPELRRNRAAIAQVVRSEEERFDAVLTAGLPKLEEVLDRAAAGSKIVPGDEVFRLYDSLGVPLDFMEDLAGQRGLTIDREGLRSRDGSAARSRARRQRVRDEEGGTSSSSATKGCSAALGRTTSSRATRRPASRRRQSSRSSTRATTDRSRAWARAEPASSSLERTPFYVESGGQVSDSGRLVNETSGASAKVAGLARTRAERPARTSRRRHHRRVHAARHRDGGRWMRSCVTRRGAITPRRTCCTRRCARCSARTSSRRVRSWRPIGCASTSCTSRRSRASSSIRSSGSSTSRSIATRRCRPKCGRPTRRWRPARWRCSARSTAIASASCRSRASAWSCAAARTSARPATSAPSSSRRKSGVAAGVRRIEALTGARRGRRCQQQRGPRSTGYSARWARRADQSVEIVQRLQSEAKRLARDVEQLKMKAALGRTADRQASARMTRKM